MGAALLRAVESIRVKTMLTPLIKDAPRRIVVPDLEVDPLADPKSSISMPPSCA